MNKKEVKIIPILIVGYARNGTTQLENIIGSFMPVASVEHFLHYGSCENQLYYLKKYWGSLKKNDRYIDFVYDLSTSDYFQLAEGDLNYHFKNVRDNVYDVFFDLMDNFTIKNNKQLWVTKIDPAFAADKKELSIFLKNLLKQYTKVRVIRIKRNPYDSVRSYLNMEGKYYNLRQRNINKIPLIFLYMCRYFNVYHNLLIKNSNIEIFNINFDDLLSDKDKTIKKIWHFLNINGEVLTNNVAYTINTSFVNSKKREDKFTKWFSILLLKVFNYFPFIPYKIQMFYLAKKVRKKPFVFRRLLKYKFFYNQLVKDLEKTHSIGLLKELKKSKP